MGKPSKVVFYFSEATRKGGKNWCGHYGYSTALRKNHSIKHKTSNKKALVQV